MGLRADRPKRRSFTAQYKAGLLAEYEAADRGERGAILHREGLHSWLIIDVAQGCRYRRPVRAGPGQRDRRDREIEALRVRAVKAEAELATTRAALDLVGRTHAPLETLSESAEPPTRSPR